MCVPGGKKGSTKSTLGGQFRNQLIGLLDTLYKTEPHFIRCVKPNHQKVSTVLTVFCLQSSGLKVCADLCCHSGSLFDIICNVACVQLCLRFLSSIPACCT
jgi:hypothetical protein